MTEELHPLLARQINQLNRDSRATVGTDAFDPQLLEALAPLLARVSTTYAQAEEQRLLIERTLEISARELRTRFKEIHDLADVRLAYERDRFQAVFEGVTAGLIIVNEQGQVAAANPEATRLLGPLHTLLGTELEQLLHVRTNQQVTRPLIDFQVLRDSPTQQRWHFSNVVISPTEALPFPADCVVVPFRSGQSRAGAVVFIIDNTARETSLADLQWQATHDTLTGLSNRLLLLDRLQHALVLAERSATWPALLFLDLDRFKAVNDRYGHGAGDRLLMETARRIEAAVRPADTVVRLGGDEFVVLCEALEHADVAEQVAERVLVALAEPFAIDGNIVSVSASIGIIHAHGVDLVAADVIRDADLAMYRAKENGRGRIETFDRDLRHETRRRVVIERALRGAIDNGELTIAYQPIFATRTGHLVAFEALARWNDPELGVVPSNEFISLAEETGLIVPLGLQQLDIACNDALQWATTSHRPIGLHVNVSARQLSGSMLLSNLQHAIREFELPPHSLTIEIPESVLIENPDRALERLRTIRELGVSVAIDDFGTGKASLAFLRHLPLDIVKIDRALVGEISKSKKDLQVMRSIVDLAAGLNFSVIAEGVEQAADLGALRSIGCEFAQGFLLGAPMTSAEALDLARRWATPTRNQLDELPSGVRLPSSKMSTQSSQTDGSAQVPKA